MQVRHKPAIESWFKHHLVSKRYLDGQHDEDDKNAPGECNEALEKDQCFFSAVRGCSNPSNYWDVDVIRDVEDDCPGREGYFSVKPYLDIPDRYTTPCGNMVAQGVGDGGKYTKEKEQKTSKFPTSPFKSIWEIAVKN